MDFSRMVNKVYGERSSTLLYASPSRPSMQSPNVGWGVPAPGLGVASPVLKVPSSLAKAATAGGASLELADRYFLAYSAKTARSPMLSELKHSCAAVLCSAHTCQPREG